MKNLRYRGVRVTVMGLGLFGGGVGSARFFAENGAQVTVTDTRSETDLRPSLEALNHLPIRFVIGRHENKDFQDADIVVVNPGVKRDSPWLKMARDNGAQVEREMNLLFKLTPHHPKLAITGSNGKSTTTALLGNILKLHNPHSATGGNIGKSLLPDVDLLTEGAPLVLELSSFMLDALRETGLSPQIAVVTNLTPNHIDWHGSLEDYYQSKRAILEFQKPEDVAILNADDPLLVEWGRTARARVIWTSVEREPQGDAAFLRGDKLIVRQRGEEEVVAHTDMLRLPGKHNIHNALMASAAALAHGVKLWQVSEVLATFNGLPHRLEMVARSSENVSYYNDSIATTPESVMCALQAFNGPITLIAGGSPKGVSFDELGRQIARRVRRLVLIGKTGPEIEAAVRRAMTVASGGPSIQYAVSLEEAARLSAQGALPGEAVLLSPACASFDMFINFEDRGAQFRELALRIAAHPERK